MKKLLAGRLNKQITFQKIVETPADNAGMTRTYEDRCKAWAEVKPIKANRYLLNKQVDETATHEVTVRYQNDLRADLVINLAEHPGDPDRRLRILSMLNVDERNHTLVINAMEFENDNNAY